MGYPFEFIIHAANIASSYPLWHVDYLGTRTCIRTVVHVDISRYRQNVPNYILLTSVQFLWHPSRGTCFEICNFFYCILCVFAILHDFKY